MLFGEHSALNMAAMASESRRRQLIADYHSSLEKIDVKSFAENLRRDLTDLEVFYGERMVCPFLRPGFVTHEQIELLSELISQITGAMQILVGYIIHDSSLQDFLGLNEIEKELISFKTGFHCVTTTSRFDTFLNGGQCSFVEFNAESPTGPGYSDCMSMAFMQRPEFVKFAEKHNVKTFDISKSLLEALLQSWYEWSKGSEKPVIAIVDYAGIPTSHEFNILSRYFQGCGYECLIADPRNLDYDGEKLSYKGTKIDLIYRRVLTSEFIDEFSKVQNMYRAVKDHKVCVVNSFRTKILHKKLIFALLTDPKYQDLFTVQQREAIKSCISWTRRFVPGMTSDPKGKDVDLYKFVKENKDDLVLKPNDSYGGRGIVFGWESTDEQWEEAMQKCSSADYLVQTRIYQSRELFPLWSEEKGLEWGEFHVDFDPYAFNFKMSGATGRLSKSALCNVTSGGGSIPCMMV